MIDDKFAGDIERCLEAGGAAQLGSADRHGAWSEAGSIVKPRQSSLALDPGAQVLPHTWEEDILRRNGNPCSAQSAETKAVHGAA